MTITNRVVEMRVCLIAGLNPGNPLEGSWHPTKDGCSKGESKNLNRQGGEGRGKAQVKQLLTQHATKNAILVKKLLHRQIFHPLLGCILTRGKCLFWGEKICFSEVTGLYLCFLYHSLYYPKKLSG